MKIAYIAAGAAGMYCGSCLHDNTLAAALIKKGHEVALIPTYTPLRTDEEDVSIHKVFFGGINIYLQQKFALFRHTPRLLDRLFDQPELLDWVSRHSAMNDAKQLGELAVATLRGEEGTLRKEIVRLSHWLKNHDRPDIVQLTNSMFVGMAHQLKADLGVPVLCAMQGEDIFLKGLIEPHKTQVLELLRQRAQEIDGFIAMTKDYADFMADYLHVPKDKIHIVKLGINTEGHGVQESRNAGSEFVIGYLARICPEKGLHLLVEAFARIAQEAKTQNVKLRVAGYLGKRDHAYFQKVLRTVKANKLEDRFEYCGEVDREQKIAFLNSLDVLSVPTTYKEPKGLFVLEALANGIPVVQPNHGAFPEMIAATGGGILVKPGSPETLAGGLCKLWLDAELRRKLGQQGKKAVHAHFSAGKMAEATLYVYRKYIV
jgi:glycosyltransferase involved in cell wall biosynthesis